MKNPINSQWSRDLYQKHGWWILVIQALLFVGFGFLVARGWGGSATPTAANNTTNTAIDDVAAGPSMWTCSMHPQIRKVAFGDCPICGMDLIPVPVTSGGLRTLAVSPESRALMDIASTPVERKYVSHEIAMVGKVDYDETKFGYITAWVPGRLDRLYVDYTGVQVNQGDHMVYIYSPELYSAQEELIQAKRYRTERSSAARGVPSIDLVESAREKLRLLGLTEEQVKDIETKNRPSDHITVYSPVTGVVIQKLKQEGDYVKTGERVYTVADLNQVWVHLDAYESDLPWIRYGQDVTITTEASPGEEFHGRIAFVQPVLNDKTRTVKVRVNVPNPDGKLKPDMFVHAVVRPRVAAAGRVMDANMAGKWISPMHPEIVKDEPGHCDVCGMPLVRAESLGFVTPETGEKHQPLVIPYSAALVTGRRAIVYVELPAMPEGLETAIQGIGAAVETGNVQQVRRVFAVLANVLDRPYEQSGTIHARQLWNGYADRFAEHALAGTRVQSKEEAADVLARLQTIMKQLRAEFAPIGQPTFEGREIVLGPRAGNYYLVRHGLQEGELVVTQGNFKIDAEIQIQGKPSMMTPAGGGGGGHDHGGEGEGKSSGSDDHAGHQMALPAEFKNQLLDLEAAYDELAKAVRQQDVGRTTAAFAQFGQALDTVDGLSLSGHADVLWKEFAMLLGNDAVEGADAKQWAEADKTFLLLKGHMRRMREQLNLNLGGQRHVESIAAPASFQADLAVVWATYLEIQKELAADKYPEARAALAGLDSAVAAVDGSVLSDRAKGIWEREKTNLSKLIDGLRQAQDIKQLRGEFKPLSEEVGVLARSFGFGETGSIYELHCPMAFEGQGAVWYQSNDDVLNPYYGSTMLRCADRVEPLERDPPAPSEMHDSHADHGNTESE